MASTTTRRLREKLSATMARAAKGEEILVTRRGKPYVRLLPASRDGGAKHGQSLRGSVLRMADDFDAPLDEVWSAFDR
jgi:prevent-host-death family protein